MFALIQSIIRYCAECNTKHPAQDGDVWTEVGMLGVNWTCYACFDGEVCLFGLNGKENTFFKQAIRPS